MNNNNNSNNSNNYNNSNNSNNYNNSNNSNNYYNSNNSNNFSYSINTNDTQKDDPLDAFMVDLTGNMSVEERDALGGTGQHINNDHGDSSTAASSTERYYGDEEGAGESQTQATQNFFQNEYNPKGDYGRCTIDTSQNFSAPAIVRIGRTVMPCAFMGQITHVSAADVRAVGSVRTNSS